MTFVTEQDARKRWCPFALVLDGKFSHGAAGNFIAGTAASVNRTKSTELQDGLKCIASVCMAWRWGASAETLSSWDAPGPEWRKTQEHTYDTLPQWAREIPITERVGFCGLAGRPE